jgi:hypothetical protein
MKMLSHSRSFSFFLVSTVALQNCTKDGVAFCMIFLLELVVATQNNISLVR